MSYSDSLTYYYLVTKQKVVNIYNYMIINLFGFTDIRMLVNNKKRSVIFRYFMYGCASYVVNFFDYLKNMSIYMRDFIDIRGEKLHLTKITNKGEKTIILENNDQSMISLGDVSRQLSIIQPDDNMLNCIFLTFELVNSDTNKVCLKEYIIKYKDINENHQHTLKNIFEFNDIEHSDDSIINVKLAKNKKIMSFNIPFKEVNDKHINYFINLEK